VVRAISAHHHEIEMETVEDVLVATADAVSAARPGARRETTETYIERLRSLEDIALTTAASTRPTPSRRDARSG
jgi:ribonuclease Y